jgi:tRNA G26 N,N-dimethylase Trm1
MCCGHTAHHGKKHGHHFGGSCGCGGHAHLGPVFWSKKRKIKMLEQVLENLKEEVKDIEELLEELKKEK